MKHIYFLFYATPLFFLFSCGNPIDFNDNQRGLLNFKVVDQNQGPLQNVYIESLVIDNASIFEGRDIKKIASGNTNENGTASLTTLIPDFYDANYIYINGIQSSPLDIDTPIASDLDKSTILILNSDTLTNSTINLPEIEIKDVGNLIISLVNTIDTTTDIEVSASILFDAALEYYVFKNNELSKIDDQNLINGTAIVRNQFSTSSVELRLIIPSTVKIEVTKSTETETETETITLSITDFENTYTYEY